MNRKSHVMRHVIKLQVLGALKSWAFRGTSKGALLTQFCMLDWAEK